MVLKDISATARRALPLLVATLFAVPAAARQTLQCPERLRVAEAPLQSPDLPVAEAPLQSPDLPADARVAFAAAPSLRLFSSGVYSGPPREMAALVPSNEDTRRPGDAGVSIWRFDAPDPHGLYLVCGYGPDGLVQVSRHVGDVARCEARPLRASGTGPAAGTLFVCE
ncbi:MULTISPECIES: STY0301 family protein [Xanthomonas]|uniref:STY0301 family protein n=1 Tax=Xanthomonas TaxID=338 RepID=UPI00123D5B07|nr:MULTISPECIES: STY0301 family protein [Xanthomonas]KAA8921756.1 hypothetical protein CEK64_00355 [Xanthomonas sontii]KAB7765352.1 hypothetical protein CEK68_11645 [Xanthomonas sp. LMG 12461]MCW0366106.1 hypothetical protein [Xanthomonas sacchari]MCW0425943.1 hypothetical protein [Xanthomonas sacchari]MCW0440170.1 hypothetical protein [Xanthomonas sacchari]